MGRGKERKERRKVMDKKKSRGKRVFHIPILRQIDH